MRRVHRFMPSPAMVVACVALLVALGGVGYAATLPGNSVGTAQLKKNAVTSIKVKDRSLLARDFKRGQLPRGLRGLRGLTGAIGAKGDKGDKGDTGAPGPFPDGDVPSGKTLRGAFAVRGVETSVDPAYSNISFGFTLASAPTTHYINEGVAPPAQCPGTVTNPQAQAGHLCVYEEDGSNLGTRGLFDPTTGTNGPASRYGAVIFARALGAGTFYAWGTWAVTAP